jgi:hypothetical protein
MLEPNVQALFDELDVNLLRIVQALELNVGEINFAYAAGASLRRRIADDYVERHIGDCDKTRPKAAAAAIIMAGLHLRKWTEDLQQRVGITSG